MANILVVDDELGIRDLLFEILDDEGHQVELAENAAQARAARQRQAPDLVLLDIWMPDTDGVTLLKEWAGQGLLTMPVVMMSGHATIDTAVEATRIGAVAFLEKPITLQKLLLAVKDALTKGLRRAASPSRVAAAAASPRGVVAESGLHGAVVAEAPGVPEGFAMVELGRPLRDARDAFELAYFEYHLELANGSMTRVAEPTGLARTHLYRKLKQLRGGREDGSDEPTA
ncbi:MAG: response regulator [Burkholderiaceae bacterium]